jgi:hypothetical protein
VSHGDLDAADALGDDGADLEELQPNGSEGCHRELGMGEADAAECREQHVGHRGERKTELVGSHRFRTGAIGEEVQLALLDPVFPRSGVCPSGRTRSGGVFDRWSGVLLLVPFRAEVAK